MQALLCYLKAYHDIMEQFLDSSLHVPRARGQTVHKKVEVMQQTTQHGEEEALHEEEGEDEEITPNGKLEALQEEEKELEEASKHEDPLPMSQSVAV